jgi:ubiquitin-conjugating enzyme E2 J2
MGESVRGKSSDPTPSQPPRQPAPPRIVEQPRAAPAPQPVAVAEPKAAAEANSSDASGGWADIIWQKWRWGVFIAIAVIVSRLSSS